MKSVVKNGRGSALLNAIIVAGVVAGVTAVILSQTQTTNKMSRNPRIKSAMTVLETQMLSMAMQPGIYQGCSAQAQNCQLNSTAVAAFQNLNHTIVGAHCGTPNGSKGGSGVSSSSCGVKVQAASSLACLNGQNPTYNASCAAGQFYNSATQTFCAEIYYQGTDVAMQPVCASTTVPQSVLQGDSTSCATAANLAGPYPKIIFKGYDAAGNAVCAPIPACGGGVNVNAPGNYVTSIDKLSMQTQCKTLSAGLLSCPAGSILSNLQWTNVNSNFGTISATGNCMPRKKPIDIHRVQATTSISSPPVTYVVTSTPTTMASAPTTTLPPTPWNCYDGFGVCGSGIAIVDDASVSYNNPGSASISLKANPSNGAPTARCICTAGALTKVSCDPTTSRGYYTCSGGTTALPACPYPGTVPGPYCGYSFSANAWYCAPHGVVAAQTIPCS